MGHAPGHTGSVSRPTKRTARGAGTAQSRMICVRLPACSQPMSDAPIRRSEIVRADYNMSVVTLRDRGERYRSSTKKIRHFVAVTAPRLYNRGSRAGVNRQADRHIHHGPAGRNGDRPGQGSSPGPDQLALRGGRDRTPAVPALHQGPDAGDRDVGQDRGNPVGSSRQCPRHHGSAAIWRGHRRPGDGH